MLGGEIFLAAFFWGEMPTVPSPLMGEGVCTLGGRMSASHAPAEMADQFVREEDVFFLCPAADIVDDERVAIGGDLV